MPKMTAADYAALCFGESFGGIYRALPTMPKPPKQAFVEEIAELCMVSLQTVRMWIAGVQRPDALKQKLISEHLGVPADILFPPAAEK